MVLGVPNDIDNYIEVNSEDMYKLHVLGFEPLYRTIDFNKYFFLKTTELITMVDKIHTKGVREQI